MKSKNEVKSNIKALGEAIESCTTAVASELDGSNLSPNTAEDISSRYWLMTFLEPLNRKELKSIVDGFMVPLLDENQAKKIVKFLLARFPNYYKDYIKKEEPNVVEVTETETETKVELPPEMIPDEYKVESSTELPELESIVTVDFDGKNKEGKVISIHSSGDMVDVDFGNGDIWGITLNRII